MNNEKNLKNSINKAMKTPANKPHVDSTNGQHNEYVETNNQEYTEADIIAQAKDTYEQKQKKKKLEKPLKIFGGICIALTVMAFILSPTSSVDTSESAKNALKNKVSTAISAGTVLLTKDENVAAKDYTITHKSGNKDMKIWVWDYAAEDGDYVQVLVNGTPISDPFMIKHKPKELIVPATGEVQIKGIRDGGGGITYAVRYEVNGTSYFNGTPEGELNTYTIRKE
jgi:hypothetical protein